MVWDFWYLFPALIGVMGIKLDLEKAYDFLNWDYIRNVLQIFGLNDKWVTLIMKCITSTSFSILINGVPHRHFYPKTGVRQGDPLSPYIFILCIEPLIRHLSLIVSNPKSHVGILSSPRGFKISKLVFSDDCLLFAKATVKGAKTILSILNMFTRVA